MLYLITIIHYIITILYYMKCTLYTIQDQKKLVFVNITL